ncbi:MAG: HAMP domain-containing sensor histidine kinase [Cyanobacteria bacterium P01_D01_bin.123]
MQIFERAETLSEARLYLDRMLDATARAEIAQEEYLEFKAQSFLDRFAEAEDEVFAQLEGLREVIEEENEEDEEDDILTPLESLIIAKLELLGEGNEWRNNNVFNPDNPPEWLRENRRLQDEIESNIVEIKASLQEYESDTSWENFARLQKLTQWHAGLTVGFIGLTSLLFGLIYRHFETLRQSTLSLGESVTQLESQIETQRTESSQLNLDLQLEMDRRKGIESTYQKIVQEKELNDLKLKFFSLASHELRTPLSGILVATQLLQQAKGELSAEKRSRNLRRIQSAAKTMAQLLADILILTRAEAGKLEFNPEPLELQPFCQRLIEEVKFNSQAHHHLSLNYAGDIDFVYLDEKLLRSILMGLLTNAIKYSPEESEIQLNVKSDKRQTIFEVCDRGIGIPLEDQQLLFESFQRGQNVGHISGTGLGLAVVKKCLELHGGSIQMDSEVGVGTTFTIALPWSEPEEIESDRRGLAEAERAT